MNRESEVCFQPWYNPLWLTGLKAPTNKIAFWIVLLFFSLSFLAGHQRLNEYLLQLYHFSRGSRFEFPDVLYNYVNL